MSVSPSLDPNAGSPYPPKQAPLGPVPLGPLPARPLVSVIVPSYNQGRFIRATIDSILSQDYGPIEILVIDGGSKDETVDVLKSYGDRPELNWVSEPDRGVVHAVNKGFAKANGDILAIQSSDDCYLPGAISRAVIEIRARSDVGLVYGDTTKVDADGRELSTYRGGPFSIEGFLLLRTSIPQPSAFFRRELLEELGGWDERVPYTPDTDLWLRIAFHTTVVKIDNSLSLRRMHDEQRDNQVACIVRDYCQMIDLSEDVRRSSARMRRAAQAAKYLIRVRYNPSRSYWCAAWNTLRAGMVFPECRNLRGVLMNLTYFPARTALAPWKRWCMAHLVSSTRAKFVRRQQS